LIVNAKGNKRSGKLNLEETVKDCLDAGYMEFLSDGYHIKNMVTENLWCVYDRDFEKKDLGSIDRGDNIAWDIAIQSAQRTGLNVAWSNDAFELWVLLHFESVTPAQAQHRDLVYDRLTEVFKSLDPVSAELKAFTSHQHFNYKGAFKRRSPFEEFVLPELRKRTVDAIQRASTLAAAYSENMPFHSRNPCTMVHVLIQDMLANGGTTG